MFLVRNSSGEGYFEILWFDFRTFFFAILVRWGLGVLRIMCALVVFHAKLV